MVEGKQKWKAWLYLAPAIVLLLVFTVWPIINTVRMAFLEGYSGLKVAGGESFAFGVGNFVKVIKYQKFLSCLKNTVLLCVLTVPISSLLALLVAVFLNSIKWLQKPLQKAPGVVQRLYSLLLIILGWVIFALTDFGAIGNYFAALFGAHGGADAQTMYLLTTNISLLLVAALACTRWPAHAANDLLTRLPRAAQTLLRCLFYAAVLLMCVAFLVGDSYNPFLYFRF